MGISVLLYLEHERCLIGYYNVCKQPKRLLTPSPKRLKTNPLVIFCFLFLSQVCNLQNPYSFLIILILPLFFTPLFCSFFFSSYLSSILYPIIYFFVNYLFSFSNNVLENKEKIPKSPKVFLKIFRILYGIF